MSCNIFPRQHLHCCLAARRIYAKPNILNLLYSELAGLPQGSLSFPHLSYLFHLPFVHEFDIISSKSALILY